MEEGRIDIHGLLAHFEAATRVAESNTSWIAVGKKVAELKERPKSCSQNLGIKLSDPRD